MKIWIGDEYSVDVHAKVSWIRNNVPTDKYKILNEGFLINEYFVEFFDEKHETLYRIKYPQ